MATAVASPRARLRPDPDRRPAASRATTYALGGGLLLFLIALATWHQTRGLSTGFWMDEGLSVGIASHHFSAIPDVLKQDGSPPLYYMLLHVWMDLFGTTEARTHMLSAVAAVLLVPVGLWAGWSIFTPRVGWVCALLCALNPFLTYYGGETRMYSLLALFGLTTTTLLVLVFVLRRRRWSVPLALSLAAMIYTHGWGLFMGIGCFAAVLVLLRAQPKEEQRGMLVDGAISFGGAALLFAPWLPTLLEQSRHTAAPWSTAPRLGAPVQISRGLLGGDRAAVPLLVGAGFGLAQVLRSKETVASRDRRAVTAIAVVVLVTLVVAWVVSQISPAWTTRYFGIVVGPLLLLGALGLVRARRMGMAVLAIIVFFWIIPTQYTGGVKSDNRDIAAEIGPQLRPGDLVVSGQPEQMPTLAYYFGPDKRYAHTVVGKVQRDPYVMDWRDAVDAYKRGDPPRDVNNLVATLKPGQHVLFVRPFTEGVSNWKAPWTKLVRRRSAQWGHYLATDPRLKRVAVGPRFYRGATTVGNSAVLYVRNG